jgi:hypothetical protein
MEVLLSLTASMRRSFNGKTSLSKPIIAGFDFPIPLQGIAADARRAFEQCGEGL